jgi:hypothetical protein
MRSLCEPRTMSAAAGCIDVIEAGRAGAGRPLARPVDRLWGGFVAADVVGRGFMRGFVHGNAVAQ